MPSVPLSDALDIPMIPSATDILEMADIGKLQCYIPHMRLIICCTATGNVSPAPFCLLFCFFLGDTLLMHCISPFPRIECHLAPNRHSRQPRCTGSTFAMVQAATLYYACGPRARSGLVGAIRREQSRRPRILQRCIVHGTSGTRDASVLRGASIDRCWGMGGVSDFSGG